MIDYSPKYTRKSSSDFVVERLPDGSTAVFDRATKTVHSLNASAAAAFEACREPKTVSELAHEMGQALSAPVTDAVALAAAGELEQAGLVVGTGVPQAEPERASRRAILKAAGVALPVVLSLTAAEQQAHAATAASGAATTTPAPTTTRIAV
jgi:hypothetical protein